MFLYVKKENIMLDRGFYKNKKRQSEVIQIPQYSSLNQPSTLPIPIDNQKININPNTQINIQPKWVKKMLTIMESSNFSREEKIDTLLLQLNNSSTDEEREALLTQLATLNPVEGVDKILPYLNHKQDKVSIAALSALNNAMLPTEKEVSQQANNPNFDIYRKNISLSVNELLKKTKSDIILNAIITGYGTTNPSNQDTQSMVNLILSTTHNNIVNGASYIASIIFRTPEDAKKFVPIIPSITDNKQKISIIRSIVTIGSMDTPAITRLSKETRNQLSDFLRKNSYLINDLSQIDSLKITLKKLNQ